MNRVFTKLKEELLAILPPTLYFFVADPIEASVELGDAS